MRLLAESITGVRTEAVRADVAQVRADFERRDVERLGSLEARVTALEVRAGLRR